MITLITLLKPGQTISYAAGTLENGDREYFSGTVVSVNRVAGEEASDMVQLATDVHPQGVIYPIDGVALVISMYRVRVVSNADNSIYWSAPYEHGVACHLRDNAIAVGDKASVVEVAQPVATVDGWQSDEAPATEAPATVEGGATDEG